jgi:hypothetical protein
MPHVLSVADPTRYPLAFPKEVRNSTTASMSKLIWKNREYSVNTDASVSVTPGTTVIPNEQLKNLLVRADETEIVTVGQGAQGYSNETPISSGFLQFFFMGGDERLWLDGDDWRPNLVILGTIAAAYDADPDDPFNDEESAILRFSSTIDLAGPFPPTYRGTITGQFCGLSLPLHVWADGYNGGSYNFTTFDLDVTTHWSWAGKYDTATGLYL